jgi:hypothetical protein
LNPQSLVRQTNILTAKLPLQSTIKCWFNLALAAKSDFNEDPIKGFTPKFGELINLIEWLGWINLPKFSMIFTDPTNLNKFERLREAQKNKLVNQ